jgi:hypothetical protein
MYGIGDSCCKTNMAKRIQSRQLRRFSRKASREQSIRKRSTHSVRSFRDSIRNFDGKRIQYFAFDSQTRSEVNSTAEHEIGGRSLHKDGQYLLPRSEWSI